MSNDTDSEGKLEKIKKSATPNSTSQIAQTNESSASSEGVDITLAEGSKGQRKSKDERKNVFERMLRILFRLLQREKMPITEPIASNSTGQESDAVVCCVYDPTIAQDPAEMIPFTHYYKPFVTKKWLENGSRPNRVMYNACMELLLQVWYWGEISRTDAQLQLKDKPVGSFLVRDSETGGSLKCWYTLSFRVLNRTLHYRLEYRANYWKFEEFQYESIVEMIEDILHRCTKENFVCFVRDSNEMQPPLPVVLKHPVSRYIKIMKLQDLCRRVIQRTFPDDQVQKFDIPVKLQEYLREKRELVFQSS